MLDTRKDILKRGWRRSFNAMDVKRPFAITMTLTNMYHTGEKSYNVACQKAATIVQILVST